MKKYNLITYPSPTSPLEQYKRMEVRSDGVFYLCSEVDQVIAELMAANHGQSGEIGRRNYELAAKDEEISRLNRIICDCAKPENVKHFTKEDIEKLAAKNAEIAEQRKDLDKAWSTVASCSRDLAARDKTIAQFLEVFADMPNGAAYDGLIRSILGPHSEAR